MNRRQFLMGGSASACLLLGRLIAVEPKRRLLDWLVDKGCKLGSLQVFVGVEVMDRLRAEFAGNEIELGRREPEELAHLYFNVDRFPWRMDALGALIEPYINVGGQTRINPVYVAAPCDVAFAYPLDQLTKRPHYAVFDRDTLEVVKESVA